MVKNLLPMQEAYETRFESLGLEDLLEEGMATGLVVLPRESLWTEEPRSLQFIALQRVGHN